MIELKELLSIDTDWFEIICPREYSVVLHSRVTGHDWYLLEQEANGHRTFRISHRHERSMPFHPQKNRPSIPACCEYIKGHDAFHLRRIKEKEERRRKRAYIRHMGKEG